MDHIDAAAELFSSVMADVASYGDTIHSEEDTRLKVITPVLHRVLGWPLSETSTEEPSGGGFIDYKFSIKGRGRLIVEAKRDSRDLGLSHRAAARPFRLNGPVFSAQAAKEGIAQAIRYCGQKNTELACVTNGREWMVLRGSRLGDGLDTMDGMAFVFPTLESIQQHFATFYDLLSHNGAADFKYRAFFQEAEGIVIRPRAFHRAVRDPRSKRLLRANRLGTDLNRVMSSFFQRLSGDNDPNLLAECFVITRESDKADATLARISEDLVGTIRGLDTESGEQLTELIERIRQTQRHEFVLLVGTKGAGKSTFIDRFFRHVLPKEISQHCVVARVNVAESEGNEANIINWLNRALLTEIERTVFGQNGPSFEDLQGMFFDDYKRLSNGAWKPVYDSNRDLFRQQFGNRIEELRTNQPHEYILGIVRQIVNSRKKVPCLIFDNADHFTIEFQERVFQYARSIYEAVLCMVIMPITDRTSWQLSREGALRSFENHSLFLPTPDPRRVLDRRIKYLESQLDAERRQPGRDYFVNRGIHVSIDNLAAFSSALQSVFLSSSIVSRWIGNLANQDIRRCLEIAQSIIASPHLEISELVETYVTGTDMRIPPYKVQRALIQGDYNIYPNEINKYVRNTYALVDGVEASPLMTVRILQLLRDVRRSESESEYEDRFISVDQIVQYFQAMQVESAITIKFLGKMLDFGLCQSYDPTVTTIEDASKLEITLAGVQHLNWSRFDQDYNLAMLEVTPILDERAYDDLAGLCSQERRLTFRQRLRDFASYLAGEDQLYCRVPDHQAYRSQQKIVMGSRASQVTPRALPV